LKTKDKIAIIGPYPPPYGGISVHVQRVLQYLSENQYVFFNSSNTRFEGDISFYGKIKYIKVWRFLFKKYKLVHTHSTDTYLRIILGIIGIFRKNIYLHIHGVSLSNLLNKRGMVSFIIKLLIKNLHIIVVNLELVREINKYKPISIHKIDAFLPPTFDFPLLIKTLKEHEQFFQNGRFIVSMNGWFTKYMGEDLYGFDLASEVLKKFRDNGINIFIVACIKGVKDKQLYKSFLNYITTHNIDKQFLLIHGLEEAWPIFMASNVFMRLTNTDGLPVSIKEAIWFRTKVIASDCIVRPNTVFLFKNRSVKDLYEKLFKIFMQPQLDLKDKINQYKPKDFNYSLFSEIYKL